MKALVGAFNQEKALVGAFPWLWKPVVEPMEHYTALLLTLTPSPLWPQLYKSQLSIQSSYNNLTQQWATTGTPRRPLNLKSSTNYFKNFKKNSDHFLKQFSTQLLNYRLEVGWSKWLSGGEIQNIKLTIWQCIRLWDWLSNEIPTFKLKYFPQFWHCWALPAPEAMGG